MHTTNGFLMQHIWEILFLYIEWNLTAKKWKLHSQEKNAKQDLATQDLRFFLTILLTAGDIVFDISNTKMSVEPFTNFAKRKAVNNKLNATDPQYGLCLKTYNRPHIVTGKHGVDRWRKRN